MRKTQWFLWQNGQGYVWAIDLAEVAQVTMEENYNSDGDYLSLRTRSGDPMGTSGPCATKLYRAWRAYVSNEPIE